MMAQKHLHELLKEDQEPFLLKNYIADRRCQLNQSSPKTHLQINKRKPISQNSNFTSDFCKKACFLSFHESPDLRKSPLFQAKSPTNNDNTIFLLEAALRIQKHRSSSKIKPQSKNGNGFGLFGSILKRLTQRTRNPKRETENIIVEEKSEENSKEMDLVASCRCSQANEFASYDRQFSQSPFRFVLKTSSPSRHERQDKENYELESLKRLQVEEEDEEKEQCSPVSVLDRPFEDNDNDDTGIDRFDLECSYAIAQRSKQQLLQNLRRFEKLDELDPIELEKRTVEQEQCEMHIPGYNPNPKHIQDGMKRLVSDLIAEEETTQHNGCVDKQAVSERVSKRLESWKYVESNTIDMMVEQDFRRDQVEGWKGNEEHIRETGTEVESAIFGLLMQELLEELVF